jgi:hypothetical protein
MSRPETTADVTEKFIRFATFDVDKVIAKPKLLKAYTALIEAVQAEGGEVNVTYSSNVEISLKRNQKQLLEQLHSDQYRWDDNKKNYELAIAGEEVPNYRRSSIQEWAKNEGLPDPLRVDEDADVS